MIIDTRKFTIATPANAAQPPAAPQPSEEPCKEFKVGRTYFDRSACDYDTVFVFTVQKRTKKFLHLRDRHGRVTRRGIYVGSDGVERCKPNGTYSMCTVICADRPLD